MKRHNETHRHAKKAGATTGHGPTGSTKRARRQSQKQRPGRLYLFSSLFAVMLGVVVILLNHHKSSGQSDQARALKEQQAQGPTVTVTAVKNAPPAKELVLIGETRPYAETTVYAKLSGYLRNVFVDKGDVVKADQALAVIESPETNMAYLAAKADAYNKKRIAARMRFLLRRKLVSAQEAEQAIAASDIAQAQLQTQGVLKGYETLRAPFSGMVVARYVDPGMLIQNASNGQAASLAVVTVSQIDRLRIYVYVDQRDAPQVQLGLPVEIGLTERPEMRLTGRVTRLPQELDPRTRTMLTEIDFDNAQHQLVADSFVQVKMRLNTPPSLEVPSATLVYSGAKAYLPLVEQNHLAFKEVQVIEDDGVNARVSGPVEVGRMVAMNVGQTMGDGDPVRAQDPQKTQAHGGQGDESKGSMASGEPKKKNASDSTASNQTDKTTGQDQRGSSASGTNSSSAPGNPNAGANGLVDRQIATPPLSVDTPDTQGTKKEASSVEGADESAHSGSK